MLQLESVSKSFGGTLALRSVSLSVEAGEFLGVRGPNGSGKTTLLNVVSGVSHADSGTVRFLGSPLWEASPHDIARRGVGRTFQEVQLASHVTVTGHLLVAGAPVTGRGVGRSGMLDDTMILEATARRSAEVLETLGISHLGPEPVGYLSFGQKKLVSLAIALLRQPRFLLLDEPVAGLDDKAAGIALKVLSDARQAGIGAIIVEHRFDRFPSLCDRVLEMVAGQLGGGHEAP